jgi:hypothetical protein
MYVDSIRVDSRRIGAAAQGFQPVKILVARHGLLDFRVSVLMERNLADNNGAKVESKISGGGVSNRYCSFCLRFQTRVRNSLLQLLWRNQECFD